MLKSLWSMAAIPAAFAGFVYRNGGVAVGDKEHHTSVLHLMQIPYLLLFTAGCLAAVHLAPSRCMSLSFVVHSPCLMLCSSTSYSIAPYTLEFVAAEHGMLPRASASALSKASLMRTRAVSPMTDTSCGVSFQGAAGGHAPSLGHEEQCRQDAAAVGISGVYYLVLHTALHAGAPLPAGRQQVSACYIHILFRSLAQPCARYIHILLTTAP